MLRVGSVDGGGVEERMVAASRRSTTSSMMKDGKLDAKNEALYRAEILSRTR